MKAQIKIISSKYIDREKWDKCVCRNENGLIYAQSFFLDAMAENWSGIVVDDYEAIMPLPWKQKLGIKYLYLIPFAQQQGFVGDVKVDKKEIWDLINTDFKYYGRIAFNFSNKFLLGKDVIERNNFILNLNRPYEDFFTVFAPSLQRNIRKAQKNNLIVVDADILEAMDMYMSFCINELNLSIQKKTIDNLKKMVINLPQNFVLTKKVLSPKNELLAVGLWLKDEKRIYNIMPTSIGKGKALSAMPFLMNEVIKSYSSTNLLFDFEGSELSGVKKFYEKFSPENQPYFHYHFNKLPWPLRLFKK